MGNRAPDWVKVIRPETEDCYWVAPDRSQYPGTPEENAEVRRELLEMRIIGEKRILEKLWDHL
jgi:hypothetical protein